MRTTLLASIVLAAAAAQAQAAGSPVNQSFAGLDKNSDRFLNRTEASADKEVLKRFARFDADKDGRLSEDEYLKAMQDNDKRILADSEITAKVKADLLLAKGIPSTAISVETYEGRVMLSGVVDSKEQVAGAGRIAGAVSNVRKVQNGLMVK